MALCVHLSDDNLITISSIFCLKLVMSIEFGVFNSSYKRAVCVKRNINTNNTPSRRWY